MPKINCCLAAFGDPSLYGILLQQNFFKSISMTLKLSWRSDLKSYQLALIETREDRTALFEFLKVWNIIS